MFMRFGKHKNEPIEKLPTDYIEWFCRSIAGCDDVKAEMQRVLLARWKAKDPEKDPQKLGGSPMRKSRETQPVLFQIADQIPNNLVPWDGVSAPF